ncbi:MAG: hypothetical protein IPH62_16630 [Ignavibacteriae bacterium]|nr:hypothetical protein [Ignavibacteriota bacterium]
MYKNENQQWKPVEDKVYLQEVSTKIFTENEITSIAAFEDKFYLVMNSEIYFLNEENIEKISSSPVKVNRIISIDNSLWALTKNGLFRYSKNWELIDKNLFVDLCIHNKELYAATQNDVYKFINNKLTNIKPEGGYYSSNMTMLMEDGTQLHADPVEIGPVQKIISYSGTLYILRYGELALFDGKIVNQDFIDWGKLPSKNTNDFLAFGNRIYISTDRGLGVLRGAALTVLDGKDGLSYENTTCLEKGFEDDLWIGTKKGAVRMLKNDWQFFGADHWLPGNIVNDIAVYKSKVMIATDKGIGIINYEPFTLQKKVALYENHLENWGHKRLGFIHMLYKQGNDWIREISDNDGGHTAPYLAAMCYKYLVTGDESAKQEAINSFYAMIWLEKITPIDGFIARAIWSATGDDDEMSTQGSGGLPAKWYPTKDGKWYWKGDTSSDEIMAHFYSVSLFHDLIAEGKDKELAKEHIEKIASYISENGWVLKDMDGKPTRWGRWDAKYLLNPYGWVDKGLNGLEAQAIAKSALAISKNPKFNKAFQQLVDWGYLNHIVRQKNTFPPENIAPWDDNLAFWSYFTLLRYVDDPNLRSIYLRSLERTWEVKRLEHLSWFNFAYGVMTGNDCEAYQAVNYLREWTLDCVEHNFTNSHRDDLFIEPGYVSYEGGTKIISPRESSGNRNSFNLDGRANGNRVMDPTDFIHDYWMGRYFGLITEPKSNDKNLTTYKNESINIKGANPYSGDKRPEL